MKIDENTSDGYHTFKELYNHRNWLFISLLNHRSDAWKSKRHSDGTMFNEMFIAGIGKKKGEQITYHLPISLWRKIHAESLPNAPEWDKHTSDNVIGRLKALTPTKTDKQ